MRISCRHPTTAVAVQHGVLLERGICGSSEVRCGRRHEGSRRRVRLLCSLRSCQWGGGQLRIVFSRGQSADDGYPGLRPRVCELGTACKRGRSTIAGLTVLHAKSIGINEEFEDVVFRAVVEPFLFMQSMERLWDLAFKVLWCTRRCRACRWIW